MVKKFKLLVTRKLSLGGGDGDQISKSEFQVQTTTFNDHFVLTRESWTSALGLWLGRVRKEDVYV